MAAIDTATKQIDRNQPDRAGAAGDHYVANAVPEGDGTQDLQQLGVAGRAVHLSLGAAEGRKTVGQCRLLLPATTRARPLSRCAIRPDPGAAGFGNADLSRSNPMFSALGPRARWPRTSWSRSPPS